MDSKDVKGQCEIRQNGIHFVVKILLDGFHVSHNFASYGQ